jgi:GT2 family glycosyltransferase
LIECIEIELNAKFVSGKPLLVIIPTSSTESERFNRCKQNLCESELPYGSKIIAVVSSGPNFSFSRSVNSGLSKVVNEDVLLLNDDCFVRPDTIKNTITSSKKKVGIIGGVLTYENGKLQHNGGIFYFNVLRILLKDLLNLAPFYTIRTYLKARRLGTRYVRTFQVHAIPPKKIDFVTGAFFYIPNAVFKRTGFLDEAFINGFEDADYCLRARDLGFDIMVEPSAIAVHEEHASLKTHDSTFFQNLIVFNKKWSRHKIVELRKDS